MLARIRCCVAAGVICGMMTGLMLSGCAGNKSADKAPRGEQAGDPVVERGSPATGVPGDRLDVVPGSELAPGTDSRQPTNVAPQAVPRIARSVQPGETDLGQPEPRGALPADVRRPMGVDAEVAGSRTGDAVETKSPATAVPVPGGTFDNSGGGTVRPRGSDGLPADASPTMVDVFYATDRQAESAAEKTAGAISLVGVLCVVVVMVTLVTIGLKRPWRRLTWSAAAILAVISGLWCAQQQYSAWQDGARAARQQVRYGNERGVLQWGRCTVSIPASHEVGEVETPTLLRLEVREDARRHVMLHAVRELGEEPFYRELSERIAAAERSEVFVFVHGYNVTFEDAARRTAQIAYDVHFAGPPIFFSWPSQGGLLQYTVDETNVTWAVPHLRQFLMDIAERSGAKSINLIAHSMGNRALTEALCQVERELGGRTALFNQVILAAPDIDAEIFRRDLAPALARSARRVTLYASSNDQALAASKQVHGYARAGDSGSGLVVLPGIETIDVSLIDTSFLGHSYYGSSSPILEDIYELIHGAVPAAKRRWLQPVPYDNLTYWVFRQVQETAVHGAGRTN